MSIERDTQGKGEGEAAVEHHTSRPRENWQNPTPARDVERICRETKAKVNEVVKK
jgi:hypothetical protein